MLIRVFTTIFLSRDASIIIVTIYRVDCKQNASDSQIRNSSYKVGQKYETATLSRWHPRASNYAFRAW
jgi:hypothetical protein